jgi:hypothetical protein
MIKPYLDNLTNEQRRVLNHAFDTQIIYYYDVKDKPGIVVGVNLDRVPGLHVTEQAGCWCVAQKAVPKAK